MIDYKVINCLGHLMLAKAIEDHPDWTVHSFVASDVEETQIGQKLVMEVQIMKITRFILLLERERDNDESLGRDVNPGGLRVS